MSAVFCCLVLLATIGQVAQDQELARANKASLERMVADLGKFEFSLAVEPPQKLTVTGDAALRWSYPIRNVDDAALFVFLGKDRPELIATVMSYRDGKQDLRRAYEFLSLSPDRLAAVEHGARVWHPEKPGLTWRLVPGAPAPAGTAAQRRRQMHDLAARFHAAVQADKNRYELRLLDQPLYRYQNAKADILDGSLFALAEGTDPELILALESSAERPGWKFASGRLTRWAIEVRYQDKVVSEFEQLTGAVDAADVYHISDAGPLAAASQPPGASK